MSNQAPWPQEGSPTTPQQAAETNQAQQQQASDPRAAIVNDAKRRAANLAATGGKMAALAYEEVNKALPEDTPASVREYLAGMLAAPIVEHMVDELRTAYRYAEANRGSSAIPKRGGSK